MRYDGILVRYGETFLKSERVRKRYVSKLKSNIKKAIDVEPDEKRGLLILPYNERIMEGLGKIPGIESFSPFIRLSGLDDPRLEMLVKGKTKIKAKRSDKSFPMKSNEIARRVGLWLREKGHDMVLENPDTEITIHILRGMIVAYSETIQGLGGFPLGTNGKAVALVSGGIDSAVAAWLMIRKGVVVYPLLAMFEGDRAKRFVEVCRKLGEYHSGEKMRAFLFKMPFSTCGKNAMIIYRRFMARIADRLCDKLGCDFIITGDSLGQVASQTPKNLKLIESRNPILRPLIAYDKKEIIEIAKSIGTYEISISEWGGCERVAKKVKTTTEANLQEVREEEKRLGVDELVKKTEIKEVSLAVDHTA